jgi:hypothetical protein
VDSLIQNLSGHPMIVLAIIFIGLLIVYFLFKQLLKLALLFFLVLLAIGGYYYFKDPRTMPQNIMKTLEKTKIETGKAVEKSKDAYAQGKTIVEKGKKWAEGMDNLTVGKDKKTDQTTAQDSGRSK